MADLQNLVEELSKLTVLEAAELSKLLEEKWGVSAAAPVAAAAAPCRRRRCSGRGADRVHRHPVQGRRQEDQRHQGSPHDHRPRAEGSQGPGRSRAEGGEGRRRQGRGREDQEDARGRRRHRGGEVTLLRRAFCFGRSVSAETSWPSDLGAGGNQPISARVPVFGGEFFRAPGLTGAAAGRSG